MTDETLPATIGDRHTAGAVDLAWEVTKVNCRSPITVNAELIAAYQALRHRIRCGRLRATSWHSTIGVGVTRA